MENKYVKYLIDAGIYEKFSTYLKRNFSCWKTYNAVLKKLDKYAIDKHLIWNNTSEGRDFWRKENLKMIRYFNKN